MIDLVCPRCASAIQIDDALGGRRGKCARCGGLVDVPGNLASSIDAATFDELINDFRAPVAPPVAPPVVSPVAPPVARPGAIPGTLPGNLPVATLPQTSLVACPDCAKPVSTRAVVCPHCGCPELRICPSPAQAVDERFWALSVVARSYVGLGWAGIIAGTLALVAGLLILSGATNIEATAALPLLIIAATALVLGLLYLAIGHAILAFLAIEENTRLSRNALRRLLARTGAT